jgi:CDP-diacylglycerol pyrophosphatase
MDTVPPTPSGPPRAGRRRAGRWVLTGLFLAGLIAATGAQPAAARHQADPNVLWRIVHDRCVPDLARFHTPLPCIAVDPRAGYALLKDIDGATQVLLIPTARVTGIEDPAVRAPGARNYLRLAWANRGTVSALAGHALGRGDVVLAVNSIAGRSQNQLHIHIDCIRPDVRAAIAAHLAALGRHWAPFPAPLPAGPYVARIVRSRNLGGVNPFRLLAGGVPGAAAEMGRWTLGVVALTLPPAARPGFVLLAGRTDPATNHIAAAERLQDHACTLAHPTPQAVQAGSRSAGG